ncbi:MAG: ATP-binding protein [Verrucomicrobiota bacterium]|nr:ATP-binding protein [Verrucomicrobiota bacterium]
MKFPAFVYRQSSYALLAEALLLVLFCGTIDWLSGLEVSMSLFYGIPIMFAIWFGDRKSGLLVAILCGITWWWADILAGHVYSHVWVATWEPASCFGYFAFVAVGGAALKEKHDAVRARIALLEHTQRLEREIIEISEREQRRIGRDLHDGLCQYLAAIGCAAATLRADLLRQDLLEEAAVAEELAELLEKGVVQTRDLARGLVPVPMEEDGLPFALEGLATSVARLQNIDCSFRVQGEVKIGDTSAATHLYRIAQEAINNATRHGHANRIRIALRAEGPLATLSVADNGHGLSRTAAESPGLGLSIMRYRARLVGGQLAMTEPDDGGTRVVCTFPQREWSMEEEDAAA